MTPKDGLLHHVAVEAYSRRDDTLVYTVAVRPVAEKWIRDLLKVSTHAPIEGMWPLDEDQIQSLQKLVEVRLDAARFVYHLDGSTVVGAQERHFDEKHTRKDELR